MIEKSIIGNADDNHNNGTLLVGPSFSGKTYHMLKFLSQIRSDRDTYIIIKSTPKQYSQSRIEIKETGEEMKSVNEYENDIIVFDDFLGSSKSKYIDQFFIGGRHDNLHIYYLSQN